MVVAKRDTYEDSRQEVLAFLPSTAAEPACGNVYLPQSGVVLGILMQLNDEMVKDLAEVIAAVVAAVAAYKELMAAKEKDIADDKAYLDALEMATAATSKSGPEASCRRARPPSCGAWCSRSGTRTRTPARRF